MAATATHVEVVKRQIPLAAQAAVTVAERVAPLRTVKMQHIMVRVAAVANGIQIPTVLILPATAAAAIKA